MQRAGLAALAHGAPTVEAMRTAYARRRDLLVAGLRELGFGVPEAPQGAFYVLADARRFDTDSLRLAGRLLERAHVAVTPGIDFGAAGEGFLRFCYANSDDAIREALARMAGTFLLRSFGLPIDGIEAGQVVLSEQANEQGPALVGILAGVLESRGVELDRGRLANEPGEEHKPLLGFLETLRRLGPAFARIRERLGLSHREAAESYRKAIRNASGSPPHSRARARTASRSPPARDSPTSLVSSASDSVIPNGPTETR